MHIANSDKPVNFYSLDIILAVGYRANSAQAISFRKWATKTLRQHITKGYTINRSRVKKNYEDFLSAVESVQKLLPAGNKVQTQDVLELIKLFASTWFSLDAYDTASLPVTGASKKQVKFTAEELASAVVELKTELMANKKATELFAKEKNNGALQGIVGNIFQSVFGQEAYPALEEKAAHLLYFIVKNHPFNDGNKRTGAFSFVWFLKKAKLLDTQRITPEALTTLTLLVAESSPKEKDRIVGLILLLLKK